MRKLAIVPALVLLSACATTGTTPGDPYETFNRKMWRFDQKLDNTIMKPVAKGYIAVVPTFLRRGLSNMLANVEEPFSAINSFLQLKPTRAMNSLGRFFLNTTVGIGGFVDQASKMGIKKTPEDLGQTFAVWGFKKSTFLVLPFLGPSTVRDAAGSVASRFVDPYRIVLRKELGFWEGNAVVAFEFVDARANLIDSGADSLIDSSADSYAVIRSAYLQRRAALIANQDDDATGSGDDAALDAALDDLGPDGNVAAPADGNVAAPAGVAPGVPPAPTLAPDQPTAATTNPAPKP